MTKLKTIFFAVIFSILFLNFSACGSVQKNDSIESFETNPPFQIESATSQEWVAGVQDGGSGTKIQIQLKNVGENISFKNIYFQNNSVTPRRDGNVLIANFINKPKRDVIMSNEVSDEAKNTPTDFPFNLQKNEAVIQYIAGTNTSYYKITNIQEKEKIAYPSTGSNN